MSAANQQKQVMAGALGWSEFEQKMTELAEMQVMGRLDQQSLVERGIQYLLKLDVTSAEFAGAVAESFETGNRYWLWQRMMKQRNINGGILNISKQQLVQLHDHPGATGLLRIISGETEVWQFDQVARTGNKQKENENSDIEELVLVSHRVLKAGDSEALTPEKGNIHALRSLSNECRMLDFFIPPYQRNQRSWYEPLHNDWFDKDRIACRKIAQNDYTKA